ATDLFDEATARSIADRLTSLLAQVAADPELRVSRIRVVDDAEWQALVAGWNATDVEMADGLVSEAVGDWARRTPDALAVCCGPDTLTYAELEQRGNQVAGYLRAAGVGPESVVGLCLPRGVDMVAAIVGVWKAGGA